jgi:hypothetical protein
MLKIKEIHGWETNRNMRVVYYQIYCQYANINDEKKKFGNLKSIIIEGKYLHNGLTSDFN